MELIEIKDYMGRIIFSHEEEDNIVRRTVLKAAKDKVSLKGAVLENEDLSNLDLSGLDFSDANLKNVDFTNSNLDSVDFSYAQLDGAKLDGAFLYKTIFVDCRNLTLFGHKQIKMPIEILGLYTYRYRNIFITEQHIKIESKFRTIDEWENISDEYIKEHNLVDLKFWNKYKDAIILLARKHQQL